MKAKLLKRVRKKVSLCERNKKYYIYNNGKMVFSSEHINTCKIIYRNIIISESMNIFKPKCKKRLL